MNRDMIHHFTLIKVLNFPFRLLKRLHYKNKMIHFGDSSWIEKPLRIQGIDNIYIGNNVLINNSTWLAALPLTGTESSLIINDGCTIGDFNHIFATRKIELGKNVLTANNVYISDNLHSYLDVTIPISQQEIRQLKDIYVGEDSWLGENVCVIGASIGKHCVIGANSVVTKDIPDYSIAVGSPARVIKQYDFNLNEWVRCL